MIGEVASILAPQTGYCHTLIRRMQDAGEERPETTDARVQKSSEAKRETVTPIYSAQREIIELGDNRSAQEKIMKWGKLRRYLNRIEEEQKGRLIDTFA